MIVMANMRFKLSVLTVPCRACAGSVPRRPAAFRSTVAFLPLEFELMPLRRWSESVWRYYFCRFPRYVLS